MTQPTLAMIPSGYKDGKIYSVLPTDGVGDFDFTRASTATRINKDGLIETVSNNVPRLDYTDGSCPSLLLEPQRTNLFPYSEDFENSAWDKNTGTTITNNYAISPDGTQNASRYLGIGGSGLGDKFTLNATDNTISFWVKSNNGVNQFCQLLGDSNQVSGNLLVTTEWTRLSHTFTASGLANKVNGIFRDSSNNNIDILIWGAQLEQGSYATSYIPTNTNGSAVTRLADNAYQQNVTQVIGQTEGVLYIEFIPKDVSSTQILYQVRSSSGTIGQIDIRLTGGNISALANSGGSAQFFNMGTTPYSAGTTYRVAVRYKLNDSKIYINGSSVGSDTSCIFTGSLDQISFGENLTSLLPFVDISDARLYNTPLTDAELAKLTTI